MPGFHQTQCFQIIPCGRTRRWLRTYEDGVCPLEEGSHYHNAMIPLDDVDDPVEEIVGRGWSVRHDKYREDELLKDCPTACACGFQFTPKANRQVFTRSLYKREDGTGELCTLEDCGPGAMWDAEWHHDFPEWCGFDGKSIHVRLQDGTIWHVDGPASNCTDKGNKSHRCWPRSGAPPMISVGKNEGGPTCSAGGGSIVGHHGYHGFLRKGFLTAG